MQIPDISPTAIEIEYSLIIKAWPVKKIPGDFGGIKIRYSDDRVIASSRNNIVVQGIDADAGMKAVEEILSKLLKNIDEIQSVSEGNITNLCTTPEFVNLKEKA